jgi:DNA invertase Pin-like site-specific DNA recombinase
LCGLPSYPQGFSERKHADRPGLQKALAACRTHKAKLVIVKLDPLSRNLAFIATLMDSNVEFIAADSPHANRLTVHILAAARKSSIKARSEAADAFAANVRSAQAACAASPTP